MRNEVSLIFGRGARWKEVVSFIPRELHVWSPRLALLNN